MQALDSKDNTMACVIILESWKIVPRHGHYGSVHECEVLLLTWASPLIHLLIFLKPELYPAFKEKQCGAGERMHN